jgi:hypothetical protein
VEGGGEGGGLQVGNISAQERGQQQTMHAAFCVAAKKQQKTQLANRSHPNMELAAVAVRNWWETVSFHDEGYKGWSRVRCGGRV